MQTKQYGFDETTAVNHIKHYLPTQNPLKDFIHHNTLHAFQHLPFEEAMTEASWRFGYRTYLSLETFRQKFEQGEIQGEFINRAIRRQCGTDETEAWTFRVLEKAYNTELLPQTGRLRALWKTEYKVNMDKNTHPVLFRTLSNYLDQGISINGFPIIQNGFLDSVRALEQNSFFSIFKTREVRAILLEKQLSMADLLNLLIGDESLYEQYLLDQQMEHPGWSGMAAILESKPDTLLDKRSISLKDVIYLELLLELDVLYARFGTLWPKLSEFAEKITHAEADKHALTEWYKVLSIWQEAFEWTYYNQVLEGIRANSEKSQKMPEPVLHAFFCIDDRECSIRRHLESVEPGAVTYGTPGHFNIETYFQPEHSKFHTKICPAPLNPVHLIVEKENNGSRKKEAQFSKHTHSLLSGWIISQTLGFWTGLKLIANIFSPRVSPSSAFSFRHMDAGAALSIEHQVHEHSAEQLLIGFTVEEMAKSMEGLLKNCGLTDISTDLVYFVGHGASSINNTHYAGYDCGACSGRPGSVNARTAAHMCNHPAVRQVLSERGIRISAHTRFVGALHDTTRDEIEFYDLSGLNEKQRAAHGNHVTSFQKALSLNAKERSRRFILTETRKPENRVHQKVKLRSVSLFEPRPELNHAGNALCLIGNRDISRGLFLDRRAFLNSYDYKGDKDGNALLGILRAVAPVCGGINLEYYFSRTDNYRLGAGSKLPHNVMGLIGVANGTDGDLRAGLPLQMVEVHDPVRLLVIVENTPAFVLDVLNRDKSCAEWFCNQWINLVVLSPEDRLFYRLVDMHFEPYEPFGIKTELCRNLMEAIEQTEDNMAVMLLEEHSA